MARGARIPHRLKAQVLRIRVPRTEEGQLAEDTGWLGEGGPGPRVPGVVWGGRLRQGPSPPHPPTKSRHSELSLLLSLKDL